MSCSDYLLLLSELVDDPGCLLPPPTYTNRHKAHTVIVFIHVHVVCNGDTLSTCNIGSETLTNVIDSLLHSNSTIDTCTCIQLYMYHIQCTCTCTCTLLQYYVNRAVLNGINFTYMYMYTNIDLSWLYMYMYCIDYMYMYMYVYIVHVQCTVPEWVKVDQLPACPHAFC